VDVTGNDRSDDGGNDDGETDNSGTETDASGEPNGDGIPAAVEDRRGLIARLGAAAGVASIAGCTGGGGGGSDDEDDGDDSDGDDGTDGDDDGGPPSDGNGDDSSELEQRAIELRAILKEFEDGYDQSVLDRADEVRRQHRDSVVFVNLQSQPVSHRLATGWFVGEGQVITVKGKLRGLSTVPVHTVDGEEHEAEIVQRHPGVENLALLELDVPGEPIGRSLVADPPAPNEPLIQIGHHDEYGHWVATVGDYLRTQTFDANPEYIDEHVSNTPGLPGSGGAPVFDLDGNFVGMTNGSVPREELGPDEAPRPLNDYVYDWQMSHREWFNHLDAEQTYEEVESWL
jgi:hypothetical protein